MSQPVFAVINDHLMASKVGQGVWEVFGTVIHKFWYIHARVRTHTHKAYRDLIKHSDGQAISPADSAAGLGGAEFSYFTSTRVVV